MSTLVLFSHHNHHKGIRFDYKAISLYFFIPVIISLIKADTTRLRNFVRWGVGRSIILSGLFIRLGISVVKYYPFLSERVVCQIYGVAHRKALFATRKLPPLEWQISLVLPCTLFATLHSYHPCHPLSGRLVLSCPVHYLPLICVSHSTDWRGDVLLNL